MHCTLARPAAPGNVQFKCGVQPRCCAQHRLSASCLRCLARLNAAGHRLPVSAAADILGDGEVLHSASRDTKVAVGGGLGEGGSDQHHLGGTDGADVSLDGEVDGVVDVDARSTQEEQEEQLDVVGGLGADADAAAAAADGDGEDGVDAAQQRSPTPPPPPYDPNRIYSSATIYAVRNGNGGFAKFYYKFKNVRLTKKFLYFHMPPGACQLPPARCVGLCAAFVSSRMQAGAGAMLALCWQLHPGVLRWAQCQPPKWRRHAVCNGGSRMLPSATPPPCPRRRQA